MIHNQRREHQSFGTYFQDTHDISNVHVVLKVGNDQVWRDLGMV